MTLKEFMEHNQENKILMQFMRCLCICHDVLKIKNKKGEEHLSGASQDELVLLEMAEESEYARFLSRDSKDIKIKIGYREESYEIIKSLEFTSERKMMSMIVREQESQKVYIFSKGADGSIIPKIEALSEGDKQSISELEKFSQKGYRTLAFAYRELKEFELNQLQSLNSNSQAEYLEKGLILIGVTGVEDLLQENVTECINDFKEAGIKVWMLTGDKGETAN